MRTYESGAELAAEITKRANLFIGEFAEVPAGNWDLLVEGVDRTPRQIDLTSVLYGKLIYLVRHRPHKQKNTNTKHKTHHTKHKTI